MSDGEFFPPPIAHPKPSQPEGRWFDFLYQRRGLLFFSKKGCLTEADSDPNSNKHLGRRRSFLFFAHRKKGVPPNNVVYFLFWPDATVVCIF